MDKEDVLAHLHSYFLSSSDEHYVSTDYDSSGHNCDRDQAWVPRPTSWRKDSILCLNLGVVQEVLPSACPPSSSNWHAGVWKALPWWVACIQATHFLEFSKNYWLLSCTNYFITCMYTSIIKYNIYLINMHTYLIWMNFHSFKGSI